MSGSLMDLMPRSERKGGRGVGRKMGGESTLEHVAVWFSDGPDATE